MISAIFLLIGMGLLLILITSFISIDRIGNGRLKKNLVEHQIKPSETINIFGEVNRPGNYSMSEKSIHLSELIQKAGGFTLNANKESIVILRKEEGRRVIKSLNLTNTIWTNLDAYQLQHNDVVIIESSKRTNVYENEWQGLLPFASAFLCMAAFLFSAFKG